ncbi:heavy metal-binding domain-containing protein [Flavobacterium terrisoli]|uniref:heavy metal-binding domain-containing protein n=1 Tax=Flavobacterium terrisoli TaxID=3242195 RepID=UPI0025429212|nr:heavy metal-binding domain-containing protein [Flavobacterium buctense]
MKTKLSIIVFLFFINQFVVAQSNSQQTFYTCVMHPEIHSPKPGKCPKCGMALVKEKPKNVTLKASAKQKIITPEKKETLEKTKSESIDNLDKEKDHDMKNMENVKVNLPVKKRVIKDEPPKVVRYDLYVRDTVVNFSGKSRRAIAVNGQIPMQNT